VFLKTTFCTKAFLKISLQRFLPGDSLASLGSEPGLPQTSQVFLKRRQVFLETSPSVFKNDVLYQGVFKNLTSKVSTR